MSEAVRWSEGEPAVRRAVERWLAGAPDAGAETLRDNARRRLVRLRDAAAGELLVKHFRTGSGRHRRREAWKARIGRSPAAREHRMLRRLATAGVRVPTPRALGWLPDGDALLVLPFVRGVPLRDVLQRPRRARDAALAALGHEVARLHAAGVVHGDLHGENLLFDADGPVLLDLQHARSSRAGAARLRDLGELDYSLWDRATLGDRVRLRAAALGLRRPFDAAARERLRAVGTAARARARRHGSSRTRHVLRPGRSARALVLGEARGLCVPELEPADVAAALRAHRDALALGDHRVLKSDARSRLTAVHTGSRALVVKEVPPRGLLRALADAWRGSAGWRAWRGGHGLRVRGIGAARPLAFVERRRAGLPLASWLLLEDLREAPDALQAAARDPTGVVLSLGRLVERLHRRDVDHGDLKATHVRLAPDPRLIDLEGVRFPRRLGAARRRRALAELNASLPDAVPARDRRRAFARYALFEPFPEGAAAARKEVVRESLARRHRWSGHDCACATDARPGPSSPA